MESTWESRDVLVLDAAVRRVDEHGAPPGPTVTQLAKMTGLSVADVGRALAALSGQYVEISRGHGPEGSRRVDGIYPEARRAVGQWPTLEGWADRLIAALTEAADNEPDEQKRGRLRQLRDGAVGLGREALVALLANAATRAVGLG